MLYKKKIVFVQNKIHPIKNPMANDKRYSKFQEIISQKHETKLIAMTIDQKDIKKALCSLECILVKIPNLRFLKHIIFNFHLLKHLKTEMPDAIFINSCKSAGTIKKIKKINPKTTIIWDVMGIDSKEVIMSEEGKTFKYLKYVVYYIYESILYKHVDYIVTINECHKSMIEKSYKKNIYVLRDAADFIEENIFDLADLKNDYKGKKIVAVVAGLSRSRKRLIPFLWTAFNMPEKQFIVIGDGKYCNYYKRFCVQKNINNIDFIGYKTGRDLFEYIILADVVWSDVYLNGFPYKVFEYLSLGKATIIEDTQSSREVIRNMHNGILYKDLSELIDKINYIIANPIIKERIERNAKQCFLDNHTWLIREKQLIEMLDRIIK